MSTPRVAFLAERNVYLKFYLPVIDALLARGAEVHVWHAAAPDDPSGQKHYQFVRPEELPLRIRTQCRVRSYADGEGIRSLAGECQPEVLVSLRPKYLVLPGPPWDLPCRFVTLQHGPPDTFLPVSKQLRDYGDEIFLYTDEWRRVGESMYRHSGEDYLRIFREQFVPRTSVIGWPGLDPLRSIDPSVTRRKLDLPDRRPVVLLIPLEIESNTVVTRKTQEAMRAFTATSRAEQFTLMLRNRNPAVWPVWRKDYSEGRLMRTIRAFCDRNGAMLVGKGRQKDPFRPLFEKCCDRRFYDAADYDPPTLLELLSVSSLVIHFESGVALEAAAAGVPAIAVEMFGRRDEDLRDIGGDAYYNNEVGSVFNFPGVNQWWSLATCFERFPSLRLGDVTVDPAGRDAYLSRWIGPVDGKNGSRVADAILKRQRRYDEALTEGHRRSG